VKEVLAGTTQKEVGEEKEKRTVRPKKKNEKHWKGSMRQQRNAVERDREKKAVDPPTRKRRSDSGRK